MSFLQWGDTTHDERFAHDNRSTKTMLRQENYKKAEDAIAVDVRQASARHGRRSTLQDSSAQSSVSPLESFEIRQSSSMYIISALYLG